MLHIVQVPLSMSYQEWVALPDHPRQRNTEMHARRARRSHLKKDDPVHQDVLALQGPDGVLYKLDGHTRTFLWESGHLKKPKTLRVNLRIADSLQSFMDAYYKVDTGGAGKSSAQNLYGMCQERGLQFQSTKLRNGYFTSALDVAWGSRTRQMENATFAHKLDDWKEELLLADSCGIRNKDKNGVVAAMLLSFRRYGDVVKPFWEGYIQDRGMKFGKEKDAVEAAAEAVRNSEVLGSQSLLDLVERLLSCVVAWKEGRIFKLPARPTKIAGFRSKAEAAKVRRLQQDA